MFEFDFILFVEYLHLTRKSKDIRECFVFFLMNESVLVSTPMHVFLRGYGGQQQCVFLLLICMEMKAALKPQGKLCAHVYMLLSLGFTCKRGSLLLHAHIVSVISRKMLICLIVCKFASYSNFHFCYVIMHELKNRMEACA